MNNENGTLFPHENGGHFRGDATITDTGGCVGLAVAGRNSKPVLKIEVYILPFDSADINDYNEQNRTSWPVTVHQSGRESFFSNIRISQKAFDNLLKVYRSQLLENLIIDLQIDAWGQDSCTMEPLFLLPDDNRGTAQADGYVRRSLWIEKKLTLGSIEIAGETPYQNRMGVKMGRLVKDKDLRMIFWAIVAIGAILWFKR